MTKVNPPHTNSMSHPTLSFKKGDIVVLVRKQKKVGNWYFGHKPGTVGEVTFVREGPYPYCVRFLSDSVGCAAPFSEVEIKAAPAKVKKKYTKKYIEELFGECNKKGCSDTCPHQ